MEGTIENIGQCLAEINQTLKASIEEAAGEVVDEAEQMTSPGFGLNELAPLRVKYEEARTLLEQDQWYRACALAEEVIAAAENVQRVSLEQLTVQASSLLEIGRQLGVGSQNLDQKMADIQSGKESFSASIQSINEVILNARSLIKDELTRSLSQLMRALGAARKNGVTTAPIDRMAEEASKALEAGEMEGSFNFVREAEKELEKTTAVHNEVYDLIVLLSRLTVDLKLPPESKLCQLLHEAKVMFEAGRYDGARTSARQCYQEAETVGAEMLAPRKVQEAMDLLPVVQQLGPGADRTEGAVNQAQALIRTGDYSKALVLAKDARKRMVETITEHLLAEIAEVRAMLVQAGADCSESPAMTIVEKAESLLADRRYSDALRAIRFAKSEAGQLISLRTSVEREMARVEDALMEIEDLGIKVDEAKEIYDQSSRCRSINRHNLMVELARRALNNARTVASEQMAADLAKLEADLNIADLKGADLAQIERERKEVFIQKVQQHHFIEARKALEIYRDGLNALIELRDQCASSICKLVEDLVRVPAGSSVMEETERLMAAAQKCYDEGAFQECLGLTEECRASGAAAMQWHERCAKRLERVSEDLLVGEGRSCLDPEIAALMDSARKALAQGRYEDMDWALLKGHRLHQRAQRTATRRGLADLINLVRLFPSVGLRVDDLPPEAKTLLDTSMAEPADIRHLSETIGAVHGVAKRGIMAHLASVRERAERSPADSSLSLSLLAVAERSLAEDKLDQAIELVWDADRAVGASMTEVKELRALSHRYHGLAAIAEELGLPAGHHHDLYRQALRSRDVPATVHRLKEAVSAVEKATAAYLPHMELRSSELFNRGSFPALHITIEEGLPRTILWPQSKVLLSEDLVRKGQVSLSYRALFLAKPFVTVLEPSI
jgi:hypothetical protein